MYSMFIPVPLASQDLEKGSKTTHEQSMECSMSSLVTWSRAGLLAVRVHGRHRERAGTTGAYSQSQLS